MHTCGQRRTAASKPRLGIFCCHRGELSSFAKPTADMCMQRPNLSALPPACRGDADRGTAQAGGGDNPPSPQKLRRTRAPPSTGILSQVSMLSSGGRRFVAAAFRRLCWSRSESVLRLMRGSRGAWLIPALCLLTTSLVQARVFQRWAAGDRLSAYLSSGGTQSIYAGAVVLNGGRGELEVFALDGTLEDALQALGPSGAALQLTRVSPGLALGLLREGKHVARLVLVQPPGTPAAVLFRIDQTEADFRQATPPPAASAIAGLPAMPGATPQFLAQDLHSGASLGVSQAPAPVQSVFAALDQQFGAAGWERLLPAPAARSSAFQWYRAGNTLCALLLSESADGQGTTITMLHKRQGME